MSKVLKWLETESERLEKECDTNDDQFKTVNHSFIQGFNYALANVEVIELEESKLNENQQIVLDWLKEEMKKENMFPISCLWKLQSWHAPKNVCNAYLSLDKDRQFQLLSAFSEWFEQEEK